MTKQDYCQDGINNEDDEDNVNPNRQGEPSADHFTCCEISCLFFILGCINIGSFMTYQTLIWCSVICPSLFFALLLRMEVRVNFLCHVVCECRDAPRVLVTVAKLHEEDLNVVESQAQKKAARWCVDIEKKRIIHVRFNDNSGFELSRIPWSEEEADGLYMLFVEDDNPAEVGDTLEVALLGDGKDPSHCLYIPYQKRVFFRTLVSSSVIVLAALIAFLAATTAFVFDPSKGDGVSPSCSDDITTSGKVFTYYSWLVLRSAVFACFGANSESWALTYWYILKGR